mmetsp:Transcript_3937/g.12104  ORF Transcript_3937/g.12104 Transcript_3937/m.12104 type:complete len:200 (+) Transcript_3937:2127-2726(+)
MPGMPPPGTPGGGMPYIGAIPPGPIDLCANCACKRILRSSLRCAKATYNGFAPTIFPFNSVTARVASSGEENATKAEPLETPAASRMTLHEVIVPNSLNNSLKVSSSAPSSKFLMYKLAPAIFSMRSLLSASNLAFNSASLSAFFCARQTTHFLSSSPCLPSSSSTAFDASSGVSKHTKPKPLDFPSSSFEIITEVTGP